MQAAMVRIGSRHSNTAPNNRNFPIRTSVGTVARCRPSAVAFSYDHVKTLTRELWRCTLSSRALRLRRVERAESMLRDEGGSSKPAIKVESLVVSIVLMRKHSCSMGTRRISGIYRERELRCVMFLHLLVGRALFHRGTIW